MERGLIFDCDGVLADTELHGHLVAFNQMWNKLGVSWKWSPEQYGEKLKIGGGKERMASLFSEEGFRRVFAAPKREEDRKALYRKLAQGETAIYKEIISSEQSRRDRYQRESWRPLSPPVGSWPQHRLR